MAAPIGPGDWVECVDDCAEDGGPLRDGGFLVRGRVYCVESTSRAWLADELHESFRLVGQPDCHSGTGRKGSYATWRFRPIYRPKADFIEALQAPPQLARETEVA